VSKPYPAVRRPPHTGPIRAAVDHRVSLADKETPFFYWKSRSYADDAAHSSGKLLEHENWTVAICHFESERLPERDQK